MEAIVQLYGNHHTITEEANIYTGICFLGVQTIIICSLKCPESSELPVFGGKILKIFCWNVMKTVQFLSQHCVFSECQKSAWSTTRGRNMLLKVDTRRVQSSAWVRLTFHAAAVQSSVGLFACLEDRSSEMTQIKPLEI